MGFRPSPNGTYGSKQPANKGIEGLVGRWLVRLARRRRRSVARNGVLALTTVGARTGLQRTSPVGYFVDGDGWIIWATAAGAKNHPAWYFNLAADRDSAVIEVAGRRIPVTATQLDAGAADAKMAALLATSNAVMRRRFAGYRAATDRVIPVIRLSPRVDAPP
ncbi:nitroreductase/quinone reductase family protein [Pseudonocardia sp.]|jgi:deazaflavin-dependent oxidoreductase (nitroreductase family)|uniref:nitroreductase/quinone reductase family protein n=1 Tax=Pseudonocardia sp. TaxID=60912 RepID=UPI003D13FF87